MEGILLTASNVSEIRQAAMESQDAEELSLLARSRDKRTRRLVAGNPHTPRGVLLALAPECPGEFFLNPAFDLLLLEEPKLLEVLPVSVFKHILKRADCPQSFLEWASHHGAAGLQLAVAGRDDIDRRFLERIAAGRHVKAAELAAGRLLTMKG